MYFRPVRRLVLRATQALTRSCFLPCATCRKASYSSVVKRSFKLVPVCRGGYLRGGANPQSTSSQRLLRRQGRQQHAAAMAEADPVAVALAPAAQVDLVAILDESALLAGFQRNGF